MEKLTKYRELIKQFISQYVEILNRNPPPGVETLAIFDDERGHYQWLSLGWDGEKRVYFTTLYVRLRDGKIWVEDDKTEDGIATELVREGVPREDIVLAFYPPDMREFTDFAAA